MKSFLHDLLIRKKSLFTISLLVLINLLLKSIPASLLELGNDEVYYWTYALFPDWSHFDHPPMVGLVIQLFSFNLKLDNELFLRAGSLLLSSASLIILYLIVKKLYSLRAAYFSVLLFISSFYFNLISGLFIMPDSPQVFFVLLALFFLLPAITRKEVSSHDNLRIIMFGIFTGMAFLSKYHSLFLWFGTGLYILMHNRVWFRKPSLYISLALTLLLMLPVIYWNVENNFISFTFHSERVGLLGKFKPTAFMQFNLGQVFYHNPFVFGIGVLAIISIFRKIKSGIRGENLLLLYLSLPLVTAFTFISLFRTTLPHWTGPAFICIIILSGEYLDFLYNTAKNKVRLIIASSVALFLAVIFAGTLQVNHGIIHLNPGSEPKMRMGKNDVTLDMFGWRQLRDKFEEFLAEERIASNEHKNIVILSDGWFPGAHLDYYVAEPLDIRLLVFGDISSIHKYFWINKYRGIKSTDRVFYVTDSRNFGEPEKFNQYFSLISAKSTIGITRNGRIVKYVYIYELSGIKPGSIPASVIHG